MPSTPAGHSGVGSPVTAVAAATPAPAKTQAQSSIILLPYTDGPVPTGENAKPDIIPVPAVAAAPEIAAEEIERYSLPPSQLPSRYSHYRQNARRNVGSV